MPIVVRGLPPSLVPKMLKDKIVSKIGGFLGFQATKFTTLVVLEKDIFMLGDTIRAKIDVPASK